ncbi:hypothetical protein QQS21_009376 [Conoideocrella luteorostrata]|uniref:F5/8 type C domain-containing protein n=1 Tax=Conoideocrella luteorostrata TaxID=1105319 RepID=A0AAJ0FQC9_9HYPO|nr:hypothetical protein QQS21_009376 [Conoideocrella luteorostrata]
MKHQQFFTSLGRDSTGKAMRTILHFELKMIFQWLFLACFIQATVSLVVEGPPSNVRPHYREGSTFGTLRAAAPIGNEMDRKGWNVKCDSFEPGHECNKAIDGDEATFWHTEYEAAADLPHEIEVDIGSVKNVNGLSALPRQDNNNHGWIAQHSVSISVDRERWELVASGSWYGGDGSLKYANFETRAVRYVRLHVSSEATGNRWTSLAELKLYQAEKAQIAYDGKGKWGPTINFPTVPVAAVVNPLSGEVLVWSSYTYDDYHQSSLDRVFTSLWNPTANTVTPKLVDNTNHDMFCPGISINGEGKLVVTGGNSAQKTTFYDFESQSWTPGPDMVLPRGYQASTTLSDGRVFTIGGSWSGGRREKNGEVYDLEKQQWMNLSGAVVTPMLTHDAQGIYRADNHGWFFGWKNSSVFQAGPSVAMNWYTTSGDGGVSSAGSRMTAPDSMNGNAVMFDAVKGRILAFGGSTSYQDSNATANSYIIVIDEVGAPAEVEHAGNGLWNPRAFHTSVVLPDGKIFITGGQSYAVPFSDDNAQLTPELYDPSNDRFYQQQTNSIVRVYHSVSLLLPDGRVFNAGGGLCGNCTTNHFDGQIFTPQYLLDKNGRPVARPAIRSLKQSGFKIMLSTDGAVSSASLIRYGTSTHTVNTDQRRVPLTLNKTGHNQYSTDVPSNPGIVLPGYYMLFVMDSDGVPSVSKTVKFLV